MRPRWCSSLRASGDRLGCSLVHGDAGAAIIHREHDHRSPAPPCAPPGAAAAVAEHGHQDRAQQPRLIFFRRSTDVRNPCPPVPDFSGVFKSIPCTVLAVSAFATSMSASIAAASPSGPTPVYLLNDGFDQPTPGTVSGEAVDTPAVCMGATGTTSASEFWTTWINTPLTQVTSWITTSPDGNYTANLVYAGGPGDGLVQVLSQSPTHWVGVTQHTWTDMNSAGVWVWVVRGEVGIQFGNGGAGGGALHTSQTTGSWEWIGGCGREDGLNNEITIYATEPSIFYVDDAAVSYDATCEGEI